MRRPYWSWVSILSYCVHDDRYVNKKNCTTSSYSLWLIGIDLITVLPGCVVVCGCAVGVSGGIYVGLQAHGVQFVSKVGVITGEPKAKDGDWAGAKRANANRTARISISGTYFDTIILLNRFPARGHFN